MNVLDAIRLKRSVRRFTPDPQRAAALYAKYGLKLDVASIPQLIRAHNLRS